MASTCQAFSDPYNNAEYIGTLKKRADVLTKALSVSSWESALKLLQVVCQSRPEALNLLSGVLHFVMHHEYSTFIMTDGIKHLTLFQRALNVDVTKSHLLLISFRSLVC